MWVRLIHKIISILWKMQGLCSPVQHPDRDVTYVSFNDQGLIKAGRFTKKTWTFAILSAGRRIRLFQADGGAGLLSAFKPHLMADSIYPCDHQGGVWRDAAQVFRHHCEF